MILSYKHPIFYGNLTRLWDVFFLSYQHDEYIPTRGTIVYHCYKFASLIPVLGTSSQGVLFLCTSGITKGECRDDIIAIFTIDVSSLGECDEKIISTHICTSRENICNNGISSGECNDYKICTPIYLHQAMIQDIF